MPIIKFDKENAVRGFYFLSTIGQIACYPNDVYVISEALLRQLKRSEIPFEVIKKQNRRENNGSEPRTQVHVRPDCSHERKSHRDKL